MIGTVPAPTPSTFAARFADAAETLVGTPFRLHGHGVAGGLDCVGLAACALALCGQTVRAPRNYGLRNATIAGLLQFAPDNGFTAVADDAAVQRGDLILVSPGPAQHHLIIALDPVMIIHAHASLRRVVIQPAQPDWPPLRRWRLI